MTQTVLHFLWWNSN